MMMVHAVTASHAVDIQAGPDQGQVDGPDEPASGNATGRAMAEVVQAAAAGNQAAWNVLVDNHASMVWAIARRHGLDPDDAADVSRATWLRLATQLGRIQPPEQVGGWLAATTRRESLRALRLADPGHRA
jgi:hypothetical protein